MDLGRAHQVIHTPRRHSKESEGSASLWLSLSEQCELCELTRPLVEFCANVDVPFHYRRGFLPWWKESGRSRVTPVLGRGLLTLECTGVHFLYREPSSLRNKHLSLAMTASFWSSCPIRVVRNVPLPRNP